MPDLVSIQSQLHVVDGWSFFDYHRRDPAAYCILGLHSTSTATRRWFYWVLAQGAPVKLVHRIEVGMLDALADERRSYSTWQELHEQLRGMLTGAWGAAGV